MRPGAEMEIRVEGDGLTAYADGGRSFVLEKTGVDEFIAPGQPPTLKFTRDADKKVAGIDITANGNTNHARKIK